MNIQENIKVKGVKYNRISMHEIILFVSGETNIPECDIKGPSQKRDKAFARQLFCYFCRRYTLFTLLSVAEFINRKDHTTVIHSNQTIKDLTETDETIGARVTEMRQKFVELYNPHNFDRSGINKFVMEMGDGVLI
jgi:chromosomal replication initiation ATPase DnaA